MEYLKVRNRTISTPLLSIIKDIKSLIFSGKLAVIKPRGANISVSCVNPEHKGGHESRPSASIYIGDSTDAVNYGTYSCFTCQIASSFIHFVAMAFDQTDSWAEKWLIDNYADGTVEEEFINLLPIDLDKKCFSHFLNESILDTFESFHPYMIKRKLTKQIINKFKIKYDPKTKSIVFPVYDENNRLVLLTRRSVEGKQFIIDAGADKQSILYLYNFIKKEKITKFAIVEGQIDALTCFAYGLPAVASIGSLSKKQIDLLNKSGVRTLYTIFDNDEAGERFTKLLNTYLNKSIFVINVKLPTGYKDVNELSIELFNDCIKKAESETLL